MGRRREKYGKLKYKICKKETELQTVEKELSYMRNKLQHKGIDTYFDDSLKNSKIRLEHFKILWGVVSGKMSTSFQRENIFDSGKSLRNHPH